MISEKKNDVIHEKTTASRCGRIKVITVYFVIPLNTDKKLRDDIMCPELQ